MSRLNGRRAEAEAQGLRINVAILGAGRIAHSMAARQRSTSLRMAVCKYSFSGKSGRIKSTYTS